jgi:hypothetical protein
MRIEPEGISAPRVGKHVDSEFLRRFFLVTVGTKKYPTFSRHSTRSSRFRESDARITRLCGTSLTEVRHETVGKSPNPFRIISGNRRVYTTFGKRFQPFRQAEVDVILSVFRAVVRSQEHLVRSCHPIPPFSIGLVYTTRRFSRAAIANTILPFAAEPKNHEI